MDLFQDALLIQLQVILLRLVVLLNHLLIEEIVPVEALVCHLVQVQAFNDPVRRILRRELFKLKLPVRILLILLSVEIPFCEVFVYLAQEYAVLVALKVRVGEELAALFDQLPVLGGVVLLACVIEHSQLFDDVRD